MIKDFKVGQNYIVYFTDIPDCDGDVVWQDQFLNTYELHTFVESDRNWFTFEGTTSHAKAQYRREEMYALKFYHWV